VYEEGGAEFVLSARGVQTGLIALMKPTDGNRWALLLYFLSGLYYFAANFLNLSTTFNIARP